jgi:hypothetical protein
MPPTPAFLEHAIGHAGVNGGNPRGALWFCGIEFGHRADKEASLDAVVHRPVGAGGFPCWTPAYLENIATWNGGRDLADTWPFMQKMARVAMGYDGRAVATLPETKAYVRESLLREDKLTFQLNLYPVPFNSSGDGEFTERHRELTGFPNKTLYRAWCMEHRFPRLREVFGQYRPPLLVCVGTSFAAEYRLAFLGEARAFERPAEVISLPSGKRVDLYPANGGASVVAVAPFLGQGGLMASADLHSLGASLATRARPTS